MRLDDVENKNDASLTRACCKVGLDRSCRRDAEMPIVLRQGLRGSPPTEARKRDSPPCEGGRGGLLLLLPKSAPGFAMWRDKALSPFLTGALLGGACLRGAEPGTMAQTSARRTSKARNDRRRRAPGDVARETFCSTCSPRVGGNNSGYAATSGPD